MPAGNIASFFLRDEPDEAVCLPVDRDKHFILLEEYRPGPARFLMKIPGGCVDPREAPTDAAQREVLEEVGYGGELVHLASTYISAYSNARKHIYLMLNAVKIADPVQEPQDLARTIRVNYETFEAIVSEGNMTDLDAALAALRYLSNASQVANSSI
ncbi:NUDIX hydrolase [Phyllobacterium sp. 628]|uniref:NUDIX hydrolase n=1 Tax=Phyllobacterium sp. 628 TaxID=2718938 RepID=UPI0016628112|nr:NUDIX hydrolase [Phyllobacterium sp. 628]QND52448.1 NUDIX hydrolase [Phyllobacterium sp. 628]